MFLDSHWTTSEDPNTERRVEVYNSNFIFLFHIKQILCFELYCRHPVLIGVK